MTVLTATTVATVLLDPRDTRASWVMTDQSERLVWLDLLATTALTAPMGVLETRACVDVTARRVMLAVLASLA